MCVCDCYLPDIHLGNQSRKSCSLCQLVSANCWVHKVKTDELIQSTTESISNDCIKM